MGGRWFRPLLVVTSTVRKHSQSPEGRPAHMLTSALQAPCERHAAQFLLCHPLLFKNSGESDSRARCIIDTRGVNDACAGTSANFLQIAEAKSIKRVVIYMRRYCYYFSHGHQDGPREPNVAACLLT